MSKKKKKQGWQTERPVEQEEGYSESINDFAGSPLNIVEDNVAENNSCDSFVTLQKEFMLFSPVLFYTMFPCTSEKDTLGELIGTDFDIIRTDLLPFRLFYVSNKPNPDEFRLYGVPLEQADKFCHKIATIVCKDTPSKWACALDMRDVTIPDVKTGTVVIKYITIIGSDLTYTLLNRVNIIGDRSPIPCITSKTPENVVNSFKVLFSDPANLFNQQNTDSSDIKL